ncbi:DUF2238 domain-containing protein [Gulbenkiania mobilis]|uniref:DUF2238 domain-containing protein n=1 Tax=Gulbenkiania mobilis TaxID=397457 RepID=UPI0006BBF234|nr:DUF2238 domain-containing protein [Gulbenkiania mobilis]
MSDTPRPWLPFGLVALVAVWSFIAPHDPATWWMEALPAVVGLPLVLVLWPRFPWTRLAVWLMAVHALILLVGAHYTYALTPLGFWLQEAFDLSRNHYDRLGHLAQGFIPAILAREVLGRRLRLGRGWLLFLSTCFCLAFSALYELIEWAAALALGEGADAFLATQGDPWDTQWDMFLALTGALAAQGLLGHLHDRQLARM